MIGIERRLQAEWDLLQQLAQLNPERLVDISSEDRTFRLILLDTPARLLGSPNGELISSHNVRATYPAFFPSTPLELYVDQAFFHPNVHPITGFVCVWDRHRIENTIEAALHKLVAMMSGRLYNREASHVMQPEAFSPMSAEAIYKQLIGIAHSPLSFEQTRRRTRLS